MRTSTLDPPLRTGRAAILLCIVALLAFPALSATAAGVNALTLALVTYKPIHWGTFALFMIVIPIEGAILAKIVGKSAGDGLVPAAVVNCVSTLPWFLVVIKWTPYQETHISYLTARLMTIKGFPQFNHFLMFAAVGFLISFLIEAVILYFWWHKSPARRTLVAVAVANLVTVLLALGFMIFFPGSSFISDQPRPY